MQKSSSRAMSVWSERVGGSACDGNLFGWADVHHVQTKSGILLTSESDPLGCSIFQLENKILD